MELFLSSIICYQPLDVAKPRCVPGPILLISHSVAAILLTLDEQDSLPQPIL